MKTVIAVIIFGILTYAFASTINYGGTTCQPPAKVMTDFDLNRFFKGSWSLTHATPSVRVTDSTICRDYDVQMLEDGNIGVTYGYYENGASGNHYDIHCTGTKSGQPEATPQGYSFRCDLTNARGERTHTDITAYFIATDYDNYCLVYRCVNSDTQFEDNVFLLFRNTKPKDEEVTNILSKHGLNLGQFYSRKQATCTSKTNAKNKEV